MISAQSRFATIGIRLNRPAVVFAALLFVVACGQRANVGTENSHSPLSSGGKGTAKVVETHGDGEILGNEAYRFELRSPGTGWKLLDRDAVRQVLSGAEAGLSFGSELFGSVTIKMNPNASSSEMATILLESMPVEKKVITRIDMEYLGKEAVGFHMTGRVRDIPVEYWGRVIVRDGYTYQVLALANQGADVEAAVTAFFDSVLLTEGRISPEITHQRSPDARGMSWRLVNGVYESAVTGLRATPRGDWRVVVGESAKRINAEAEIVLVHENPEAYFIVLPERIGRTPHETYREDRLQATLAKVIGDIEHVESQATFAGQPMVLTSLTGDGAPWTFEIGVAFRDHWGIQSMGWYHAGFGEAGNTAIRNAMASVSYLSPDETEKLRSELLATPDRQNQIGMHYSLRGGVYRDYARNVTWVEPKGFWSLSVGESARKINPLAQLYGNYNNGELHMMIVAEEISQPASSEPSSGKKYHQLSFAHIRSTLKIRSSGRAKRAEIGSGRAWMSSGVLGSGGIDLEYRLVTALVGREAVQLHIWGPKENFSDSRDMVLATVHGLSMGQPLSTQNIRGGVFTDHRLGFSMKMPGKYSYKDLTSPVVKAISTYPSWGQAGADWIGVLAMASIDEGQDLNGAMDNFEGHIRGGLASTIDGREAMKEDVKLQGLPARHLTWNTSRLRVDLYIVRRDLTMYGILSTSADGSTKMRDIALAGFRLVD